MVAGLELDLPLDGLVEPGLGRDGPVAEVGDEGEEDGAVDVEAWGEVGEGAGQEVRECGMGGRTVWRCGEVGGALDGGAGGADGGEDGVDGGDDGVGGEVGEVEADGRVAVADAGAAGGLFQVFC